MVEQERIGWIVRTDMNERADDDVELLIRQHARFVYRLVYSLVRNHHDAEDATQETFLRVHRYRSRLKQVRAPRAWIGRIAWRLAMDLRRKSCKASLVDVDDLKDTLASIADGPEEAAGKEQLRSLLERLIPSLPEDLRFPLILSTVEEIRSSEIAEILGIPEASVRTRLFRARRLLREKFSVLLKGTNVERSG